MGLPISFDPHRANRSLRISKISNLRTGNCFDALVKTDVDLRRECSSRGSSCDAADRLVCNRHRRTDALIVALRTAVFTRDLSFPCCNVDLVSQVPPARSALPRERFRSLTLSGCRRSKLFALRDTSLLNHLVRGSQQRFQDGEAERTVAARGASEFGRESLIAPRPRKRRLTRVRRARPSRRR
jgi:hypothetical protein